MIRMSVSARQAQQTDTLEVFKLPSKRFAVGMIVVFVISIIGVCLLLGRLHYDELHDVARRNLHNLILVQDHFNQKLLTNSDEAINALTADLQASEIDVDALIHDYYALINNHSILQSLLILDTEGSVIFDSRPEQPSLGNNLADELFYSVHLSQDSDKWVIDQPVQNGDDNRWTVPISRAILDDNGKVSHVIVVSAFSLMWSESMDALSTSGEFVGMLTRDDGVILTTFPYVDALIGTQLSESQFSRARDNTLDLNILPSFLDGKAALVETLSMENAPATLIIEAVNVDDLFQIDTFVIIIILIASATLICGMAVLMLYLRQHHTLELQTDSLHQMNIRLQQDIQIRSKVENSLRDSEELYRIMTDLISDYAFSINVSEDNEIELDWITPSFYTMTGYSPNDYEEEFSSESRTHPDDIEIAQKDFKLTLLGKDTVAEYRYRIQSGDYIWIRVKRRPIWDDDQGRVVRFIGAVTNITAEKEAEFALRASEERYRYITELVSDGAFMIHIDKNGTAEREWLTDSFYKMTGYDSDNANSGQDINSRIHPDDRDRVERDIRQTNQNEQTISEYRWKNIITDNYIWMRVKRRPIWDEDEQRIVQIIGAVTDITAEKEANLALRESEERYRIVSELISDGAFMINVLPDGQLEPKWLTDPLLRGTDYTSDDIPQYLTLDFTVHPDDLPQIEADMKRVLAGEMVTSEYRSRIKGGKYRWMQTTRKPLWDELEGRVVSYYGVSRNINARMEAEIALRDSEERYRVISEMMVGYAYSSVVHEDGTIVREWLTDSFYTMSGYSKEAAYLEYAADRRAHPDFIDMLANDMERTLQGEETISEYPWRVQSGDYIWLRVKRRPIWNTDHTRVIRMICAGSDISIEKEAEIAMQQNQQRYREISELMSDYASSSRISDTGIQEVEWVIGSLEELTEVTPEDAINVTENLLKTVHPDDVTRIALDMEQTIQGHKTISEFRIIHDESQETRWLRVTRQPIWDEEHTRIARIMGGVTDITAQKDAETALRINEERYRTLTDLMSDYVYSLTVNSDNDLEMDWFAGSFERITGVHLENYVVKSQKDMIQGAHDVDRERSYSDIEKNFAGEQTVSEYRITHAVDHSMRWLRASRFPLVDDKTGRVVRILGAVTDITDQKMVEIALRDSEERYRQLTELLTDYAFSIRVEEDGRLFREWLVGNFEAINGYSIRRTGYIDTPEVRELHADELDEIKPDIQKTLQGEATVVEYEIINQQDKKPRWTRVTRQPIWNADHTRVIRYIGAVKEVTLEKEAEFMNREADELRQALAHEKGLHELRSRFVSMVTHEFRNPLAAIQSSTYILQKYNDRISEESRQEKFDRIYGQIARLTNLLEDLLKTGELEHHVLNFSSKKIDIVAVINELYAEYRDSIGREHELVLESDHDKILMNGDVYLLQQTLGNIISNAIKYSPLKSEVICRITLDNKEITIQVIDKGVGIPEKEYDELFKAFYRASNVSTQPGTGLGLLIAQQAIELHRGTISFTSKIGKGTTFTIKIPQGNITENDT